MPRLIFGSIVLAIVALSSASSQVSAGLSGTVTDQTGASVPFARVIAKNVDRGTERMGVTDPSGRYEFSLLSVGNYEIHATKHGFSEEVRTGIHLVLGEDATVNFRIRVGDARQQVTVSEDAPAVNTTTADISGLVGGTEIKSLPLNG